MDPLLIAQILEALTSAAQTGMQLWQQSQTTMSATDAAAVHEALLKAEAATAAMRPLVDSALTEAAKVP